MATTDMFCIVSIAVVCLFKNVILIKTFLEGQWLRLCTSTEGGIGSIPGQGTKILHPAGSLVAKPKRKKKKNVLEWNGIIQYVTF